MAKKSARTRSSLEKIEIRRIESQFSESTASVVADITFCLHGTRVSVIEERSALAVAHRLAADALEATAPTQGWGVGTELLTSYRDITKVRVSLELVVGTAAEAAEAEALLREITKGLKQPRQRNGERRCAERRPTRARSTRWPRPSP